MKQSRWVVGVLAGGLLLTSILMGAFGGQKGKDSVGLIADAAVAVALGLTAFSLFQAASANRMDLTFRFREIWYGKGRREMREYLYSVVRERLPGIISGLDFVNPAQNGLESAERHILAEALKSLLAEQLGVDLWPKTAASLQDHSPQEDVCVQDNVEAFHMQIRGIKPRDHFKKIKWNPFDALEETMADLETLALLHRRDIGGHFIREYRPVFEQLAPLILAFIIAEQLTRGKLDYKSQLISLFAHLRVQALDCKKYPAMQKWVSLVHCILDF